MEERVKTNYDHPFAFDNDLLVENLQSLLKGEEIKNLFMILLITHVLLKQK